MSANTRTPEAEGLDVVLVGSFNPAIFHPDWFLRQGLIGEQDAKEARIQDVSGEITVAQLCGMRLQCVGDRFNLGTNNVSLAERMQDLILQTFTLLSHTPVIACGINPRVHYSVGSVDYWHKIGHALAPKELVWNELVEQPGMQSLTIKAPRGGEFSGETNLTVEPSKKFSPGILVRTNYHYGLPPETAHAGAAELALKFIKSEWKPACGMARKVAEQIFKKIKPDHE
jgi:hypothetical protein